MIRAAIVGGLAFFATYAAAQSRMQYTTKKYDVNEVLQEWTNRTGTQLSEGARRALLQKLAADYQAESWEPAQAKNSMAAQIRNNGTATTTSASCDDCLVFNPELRLMSQLFSFESVSTTLNTYPLIKVSVIPSPPYDYKVTLNGTRSEATAKGLYRVSPGSTKVRIERSGKPPCEWSGMMKNGEEQSIDCRL